MSSIETLFTPARVVARDDVGSKKRALELISELMTASGSTPSQAEVFASLVERERLGSTGLGHGVAIPHGRLGNLDRAVCAFLRLDEGIDFDAADGRPVDMICGLMVPEQSAGEHLNILAMLAEMFSDTEFCERVRAARTGGEIHRALVSWRPGGAKKAVGPSA